MIDVPVVVMTSDRHNWLLRGMMHQWRKYSRDNVIIAGFTKPDFPMLDGFEFYSIGKFEDYPAGNWSDALIRVIEHLGCDHLAIFLEDYWLIRTADPYAIQLGAQVLRGDPYGLRFDLTSDRLYSGSTIDVGSFSGAPGHYLDIIMSRDVTYQFSLQAAVWRADNLLSIIKPGWSPWHMEAEGTRIINDESRRYDVFGTRQWPYRYQIMVRAGNFERSGEWMYPPRALDPDDLKNLEALGYTESA